MLRPSLPDFPSLTAPAAAPARLRSAGEPAARPGSYAARAAAGTPSVAADAPDREARMNDRETRFSARDSQLLTLSRNGQTPLLPRMAPKAAAGALLLRTSDGETRTITKPTRIGSSSDNDWVLPDSFVSQHHVLLSPDGDALLVADVGSRNGTFINGARVQRGELRLGSCLVIGRTQLRVCSTGQDSLLIGNSAAMQQVRAQIQRFAPTGMAVLVLGESGTGKELVARSLHEQSGLRGDLIAVNCGALPKELIESELFGHERGAFTGAQRRHLGCFGEADGGTLFLDEIGELPLELQPRLLRALESKAIRPVGSTREVPVEVRIVAATHQNLALAVQQGRFRADLYYRLCGLEVMIPPLRARSQDVGPLVRHFLSESGGRLQACSIADSELALVAKQPWPGNVRQLRHAVLRAMHLAGPLLTASDIVGPGASPGSARASELGFLSAPGHAAEPTATVPVLGRRFADIERDIYAHALEQTGGNRRAAAELLDVPKSTLHDKLRRLGLVASRKSAAQPA